MRPLRYSINVTLDGCCEHRAIPADEDLHRHAVENLDRVDWNAELVRLNAYPREVASATSGLRSAKGCALIGSFAALLGR